MVNSGIIVRNIDTGHVRRVTPITKREIKRQISKTACSQTSASKTGLIGPASYEALLAEDVVAAKRKRDEDDACSIELAVRNQINVQLGAPELSV